MARHSYIHKTVWPAVLAFPIAIAWLLPYHYMPWVTFHTDATMASALTLVAAWLLWTTRRQKCEWHWPAMLVALCALIPMMQFATGMLSFFGAAWINSAYLVGLLLALLLGARWERAAPGQCLDVLFLAIGAAALVSVYLAFHQLLRLDSLSDFVMRMNPLRPGANLAQPNQLSTFFILGLLAVAWAFIRQKMTAALAIGIACLFLLGQAVTLSRTGWLNVALMLSAFLCWGALSKSPKKMLVAIGLGIFFILCLIGVPLVTGTLLYESNQLSDDRFSTGARPLAWQILTDAALRQPLWGYGWGQVAAAHFNVALTHPEIGALFHQSHNLFLDLILWNGLPIGLLISALIIWWSIACMRRIDGPSDVVPILFLLSLGVHAMLEYPLHYAYFLLPAGLVAGLVCVRCRFLPAFSARPWTAIAVLVLATGMLVITMRDYLRVESVFNATLVEKANAGTPRSLSLPEVLVLTDQREMFRLAQLDPLAKFDKKELSWMRAVVNTTPTNFGINQLATALAYNGQPEEARSWLQKLCRTSPEMQCANIKKAWLVLQQNSPLFAAVGWPEKSAAVP